MRPTLIVVSGPPGSGKTTLAHQVARAIGCPAICRDEIKEGMANAAPGFVPAPGDALTMRTLPVFFGVLELLLTAGVTTVAEAAFQDKVWRPHLTPLLPAARFRVLHCVVDAELVARRVRERGARAAHPDGFRGQQRFDRIRLDVPELEVDTTAGYRPGLDQVVAFVNRAG